MELSPSSRLADLLEDLPSTSLSSNFHRSIQLMQFGLQMKRQQLVRQNPQASEDEIDLLYRSWLLYRPGDFAGPARVIALD